MYDIRHRLIWAISGFVSAVSLLVLVSLAGYGLFKALLLSLLILALVALILWILWVSEPDSLVDILAAPQPAPPSREGAPASGETASRSLPQNADVASQPENAPAQSLTNSPAGSAIAQPDNGNTPERAQGITLPLGASAMARQLASRAKSGLRRDLRGQPRPLRGGKPAVLAVSVEVVDLPDADDLLQILGLDARAAAVLERLGVTRFEQVAHLTEAEIAQIESHLDAPGRVAAEDWQGQAHALIGQTSAPSDPL